MMFRKYTTIFWVLMKRNFLMVLRYPLNMLAGLISLFLIFMAIFYGAQRLGESTNLASWGNTLSSIIMGFTLWNFITFAYSDLTWNILGEAQQGTLEQLYMCPVGFGWVCFGNIISWLVINLATTFVMLFAIMAITGYWLHMDIVSIIPLMLLIVMAIYGFGFMMAGLSLVYKQVQAVFQILQFVWLALVALPIEKFPMAKYAPIVWGSKLLKEVMVYQQSIFTLPWQDLAFLIMNSACYFFIGLFIFKRLENVARARGLLGHY